MHFKIKAVILLILTVLFFSDDALAQRGKNRYQKRRSKSRSVGKYRGGRVRGGATRFKPYHLVGVGINALNYFGDLAPVNKAASTDISFTRPGFGILYGYKFHPAMVARGSFNWGIITGDDFTSDPNGGASAARYQRNLSFRSFIKEVSIGVEFAFLANYRGPNAKPPLNGYVFLGIAGYHHQPQALTPDFDYQTGNDAPLPSGLTPGEWVNLQPLGTEGQNLPGRSDANYSLFQFAIPIGLAGEFSPPGPLTFGIELGYRFTFTDYLDDVSGTYVNLDQFNDPAARIFSDRGAEPLSSRGELRAQVNSVNNQFDNVNYNINGFVGSGLEGSIRGNPNDDDIYFITQIRVTYTIQTRRRSAAKFR